MKIISHNVRVMEKRVRRNKKIKVIIVKVGIILCKSVIYTMAAIMWLEKWDGDILVQFGCHGTLSNSNILSFFFKRSNLLSNLDH